MTKTILLTGATGFLGSHLLAKFLDNCFDVVILKRSFSNVDRIKKYIPHIKSYDIDKIELDTVFKENKIDIVVHTATNYGRNSSITELLNANLMFPILLLERAIKYGVSAFINTDTFFAKKSTNYDYLSSYSTSKRNLQIWLRYFSKDIKVINMVLEHIYGENDSDTKFVMQMIKNIAFNFVENISLTSGEQKRDFIYIDDVSNAYISVIKNISFLSENYNELEVGLGKTVSIYDFVTAIKEIANSNTTLNFGAIPYRNNEIMESVANNKILCLLGWTPKYSYKDGIKTMIDREQEFVQ